MSSSSHSGRRTSSVSRQSILETQERFGFFAAFMVNEHALRQEIVRAKSWRGKVGIDQARLSDHSNDFIDLFDVELDRVTEYLASQQESQELSAKSLLTSTIAHADRHLVYEEHSEPMLSDDEAHGLRYKVDDLVKTCLKLQQFTQENATIFQDLAVTAESQLGMKCMDRLQRRLDATPWKHCPTSGLVTCISDIYAVLRSSENQARDTEKWEAPDAFKRSTTKFWVQPDKLPELLLMVSTLVPLLVYGRSGRLTTKKDRLSISRLESDGSWDNLATPISSVYFESQNMVLYKDRIVRNEGSKLLRARWYGPKPVGDETIFLELKTHHDKWVNAKSIKERVKIQEKYMDDFLSCKTWDLEDALMMIVAAEPTMDSDRLQRNARLLLSMKQMVMDLNLRPCIRTNYVRAAFQCPGSNALRLTVDRDVTLIDETKCSGHGCWCFPDDAVIPSDMVKRVPFPIFEVKLAGSETPEVIANMARDGVITESHKFSKYLTGAAAFHAVNRRVGILPYWADHPQFAPLFHVRVPETAPNVMLTRKVEIYNSDEETGETGACNTSSSDGGQGHSLSDESVIDGEKRNKSQSPKIRYIQQAWKELLRWAGEYCGNVNKDVVTVAGKRPARVEPKSYFANERTFIQWISGAMLLVTIAALLLNFEVGKHNSYRVGFSLAVCATLIVFYAMFVYYRRLQLLRTRSPYGYIDRVGPLLFAGAVLVGIVLLASFFFDEIDDASSSSASKQEVGIFEEPDWCMQHTIRGVSLLEYEPSDIVVDGNILLVPSLDKITGVSLATVQGTNDTVSVFAELESSKGIPNDLEGLTYAGDRLFALAEEELESKLIELAWDGDVLRKVQTFKLATPNAEGIAFVPHRHHPNGGKLYVGGSIIGLEVHEGIVDVYDLPEPVNGGDDTSKSLVPKRLNNKLLVQNLDDSRIAALTYFEGVLYILHDNARVVRAWDLEEGRMLSEFSLPYVEGGFDKQWEGMALQRGPVGSFGSIEAMLRYSSQASLTLHLCLDSPPQIWSIRVTEGEAKGHLSLPSCAGGGV